MEILIIDHKHGSNVFPCTDPEDAFNELYNYVAFEWGQEMPEDEEMPADRQDAIDTYFDEVEEESYAIESFPKYRLVEVDPLNA